MKQRIPNAIYNKEFREQAVKRVQEERLSAEAVAKHTWMLNYLEEILKECILPVETHSPTKAPLP